MTYDFSFAHSPEGFDNHIDKSIRGYSNLLEDTISFSRYFVEDYTRVVDVGCSTGKLTKELVRVNRVNKPNPWYVGVELAGGFYDDMSETQKSISTEFPGTHINFVRGDVCNYQFENCSYVTSLFTLQFMPKTTRQQVLSNIYNGLNEGGGFVFAEKLMCEDARFQDMLTGLHHDYKRQSFTPEEIMNKDQELRHMMKPNTWKELNSMVLEAGFKSTQIFWRNYHFVGVIAVK